MVGTIGIGKVRPYIFLGDAALTTAILDRPRHQSVLAEFRGKSYRLNEAASRLAKPSANE